MNLKMYFLLFLFLFNCKTENKFKDFGSLKKDHFLIKLKVKVLKDDVIEVFYKNNYENKFTEIKKIRKGVAGNPEFQNVEFLISEKEFPFEFRIDLGENKQQSDVIINKVVIESNNDSITIEKEFLATFFIVNKYLSLDTKTGAFIIHVLNDRRDPFIISKALLVKKMEIEL